MRKDRPSRRTSMFRDLFAERQVYLRSGEASRYVVLSRPLQIGVALALAALVLWLGLASYGSVAKHFETVEQSRELVRLEGINQDLEKAAESARATEELRAEAARVPELVAALETAGAARDEAQAQAERATAEAERLRAELAAARTRVDLLAAALTEAGVEGLPVSDNDQRPDAAPEEQETTNGSSTELALASEEIERLTGALSEAETARGAAEAEAVSATERAEAAAGETGRLRAELEAAQGRAEELERIAQSAEGELATMRAELERVAQAAPEAGEAPSDDAAAELAALKEAAATSAEEAVRLKGDLAEAQATIAALNADLETAKAELTNARGQAPEGAAGGAPSDAEVARLREQLAAANAQVAELQEALAAAEERWVALQPALTTLVPPPPPPAPR